jgi:hypothetical protein
MSGPTLAALIRLHLARLGPNGAVLSTVLGFLIGNACAHLGVRESVAAVAVAASGSLLALAFASSRRAVRSVRSLFLFSAPLYGRQLARGLALVPCSLAALFPLAAWAGWAFTHEAHVATWLTPLLATTLAALVALSATLRDGWRAALYRTLAILSAALVAILALALNESAVAAGAAALAAVSAGFLALRAFGETIARYDFLGDF